MSLLATVKSVHETPPPIIVLHGPPGSRKTQFCIDAPSPLMLLTEQGLGNRSAPHLNLNKYSDLLDIIKELGTTEHAYKTLCIDSLDHLVPLVAKKVCDENAKPNLRSFGYGKGEEAEAEEWFTIFRYLEALRSKKGMGVILTCHSQVRVVDDPAHSDGYPRWEPKLPRKCCAIVKEKADILGCVLPKLVVRDNDDGKTRALGDGTFQLHINQKPSIEAKNRYRLDGPLDMSYAAVETALKGTTK